MGKYEIRGTLGKGAMGTVHDGWDPAIDRRVAIKTVRLPEANDPETQEALARFKREAQAAGRLSHPNIVGVFDYGETDELAFIVMEFVEGVTLKEKLAADERLPLAETLRLMDDILAGLTYSHSCGVVHRDIKPANVMITRDGRAKLADFGIARIESSSMTQAGTVMGTPAYMSPEQFMGQVVDRRTDIYSSGVLLYQLLTGERPFDGGLTVIMHKVLNTVPPRPSDLSVVAPPSLDAVVARAMARRPEDRYPGAEEFARALHEGTAGGSGLGDQAGQDATMVASPPVQRTPPTARPAVAAMPLWQRAGRLPLLAGGAAALIALAGGTAWLLRPAAPVPTPAGLNPPRAQGPVQPTAPIALPPAPRTELPPAVSPPSAPPPTASPPAASPPDALPVLVPMAPPSIAPMPVTPPPASPSPAVPVAPPSAETAGIPSPAPLARPPGVLRAALAGVMSGLRCTLASGDVTGTGLATIAGVAGAGEPQEALRRAVGAAGPAAVDWRVGTFDGPYCGMLDVLRPVAGGGGSADARMQLGFANGVSTLSDNALIAFSVTLPNFAGYIQIDYLQPDGMVNHLVPGVAYPQRTFAAGARAELGRPRPDFDGWKVGAPFGTDMVAAIISTAPLFSQPRPEAEPIGAYLRDLQAAMESIRRRGGSLAASAALLNTRP